MFYFVLVFEDLLLVSLFDMVQNTEVDKIDSSLHKICRTYSTNWYPWGYLQRPVTRRRHYFGEKSLRTYHIEGGTWTWMMKTLTWMFFRRQIRRLLVILEITLKPTEKAQSVHLNGGIIFMPKFWLFQFPISAAKFWVFPFLNSCCFEFLEHRDYVHL